MNSSDKKFFDDRAERYSLFDSKLKQYTYNLWFDSDDVGKSEIEGAIFSICREYGDLPTKCIAFDDMLNEYATLVIKSTEGFIKDNKVSTFSKIGMSLALQFLDFYDVKKNTVLSMRSLFFDDIKLKKAINTLFKMKDNPSMVNIIRNLRLITSCPSNFNVMAAKSIIEKYTPYGGSIYDFSGGYGGRLLGALGSDREYTYICTEPNTKTYDGLCNLLNFVELLNGGTRGLVLNHGSEVEIPDYFHGQFDFSFSSPPYFNLELYCDETTQCYIKYPELDLWFAGYVKPTIENIYKYLKPGGYYAVNIADFKLGSQTVKYVEKWCELSVQVGFTFIETLSLAISKRPGSGHKKVVEGGNKLEGIYVFRKNT